MVSKWLSAAARRVGRVVYTPVALVRRRMRVKARITKDLEESLRREFHDFEQVTLTFGRTRRGHSAVIAEAEGRIGRRWVYKCAAFHPKTTEFLTGIEATSSSDKVKTALIHFWEGATRFEVRTKFQGRGYAKAVLGHSMAFLHEKGVHAKIMKVENEVVRKLLEAAGATPRAGDLGFELVSSQIDSPSYRRLMLLKPQKIVFNTGVGAK